MREVDKESMHAVLQVLYNSFREGGPGGDVLDDTRLLPRVEYDQEQIEYILERLDASRYVNYEEYSNDMFRVQLLPRAVDELDDNDTIASSQTLRDVFERIYEADKHGERLTYGDLERMVGDRLELDKALWYLDHRGYIQTAPQYRLPHMTELGRRRYEDAKPALNKV